MPTQGGDADKAGNRYETLWVIHHLLRILGDEIRSIVSEPLQSGESRGVEFVLQMLDGSKEYWSIKRQRAGSSGWTLAALTASSTTSGRSILSDLFEHVRTDQQNRAVFASTLGAAELEELKSFSNDTTLFLDRLGHSIALRTKFSRYLLPLAGGELETARMLLSRTRSHAIDEEFLRSKVYEELRRGLYADSGEPLDPMAVYGLIETFLSQHIHVTIDRSILLSFLSSHGFRLRDWNAEKTVQKRMAELCEAYSSPIERDWLNGHYVALPTDRDILDCLNDAGGTKVLVVATAGSGKSSTLAHTVRKLREARVPVLPLRFDQIPDGIISTTELGRRLGLPESPVQVLAGMASGGASVLVLDQLDAVSIASGRRVDLWDLFEKLRIEVSHVPGTSLLVGCRQFDLDHDHRMRSMTADKAGFHQVHLGALTLETVEELLKAVELDPSGLTAILKEILTLPLHLSMFLSLSAQGKEAVFNQEDLFDRFWEDASRRANLRAGRQVDWIGVMDGLSSWLSKHQRLSAPKEQLDHLSADADVLTSERILISTDGQYRFFHELFFDYVFARRFLVTGRTIAQFLISDEQHLFRRAQVRQILAYIRRRDRSSYLKELRATLLHPDVRFHIKQLILQLLRSLTDPTVDEWRILEAFQASYADLAGHIRGVIYGVPVWFDVLKGAGYFDQVLSKGSEEHQREAISVLSARDVIRLRAADVRTILFAHRRPDNPWDGFLVEICRSGEFHRDRKLFEIFLELLENEKIGAPDAVSQHGAELRYLLHSVIEENPAWAAEAIAVWLKMMRSAWNRTAVLQNESIRSFESRFGTFLDRSGFDGGAIRDAAKDFRAFARHVFPVLVAIIRESSYKPAKYLLRDDTWSVRGYGSSHLQLHAELFEQLALSLERLAVASPDELDCLIEEHIESDFDSITYLILRAKAANPQRYAEGVLEYLACDVRRLTVGYAFWSGGGGSAEDLTSINAVRVCAPMASDTTVLSVESAIIGMKDGVGGRWKGARQLRLLDAIPAERQSDRAKKHLAELRRKFTNFRYGSPEPSDDELSWVGPPISSKAQSKMTDAQWIRALDKYQGKEFRSALSLSGGEQELANALESRTKENPRRFCALAQKMDDNTASSYFEAILRGVSERGKEAADDNLFHDACGLIRRVHRLPQQPCGKWLCWLVQSWTDIRWPDDIVDIVSWYATHDADPTPGSPAAFEASTTGELDAFDDGMNSTRGAAAQAIAHILFEDPERFDTVARSVRTLTQDPVLAVRASTVTALLACLNRWPDEAIRWFIDSVAIDPSLIRTYHVERFVFFATLRNESEMARIFALMFESKDAKVQGAVARVVSTLGLNGETVQNWAARARSGSELQREAAARVYADNVAHKEYGRLSLAYVKEFMRDPASSVRLQAASSLHELSSLATREQEDLIETFLDSRPDTAGFQILLSQLEQSPVELPGLVLKVVKLAASEIDPNDRSQRSHRASTDLPKIVVRLLVQSDDPQLRSQCLNLIDEMGKRFYLGIAEELQRAVR
jgi:hypothetical protein